MVYRPPRPGSTVSAESMVAEAAEIQHPAFLEALVAAVALVTHADGESAPAERDQLVSVMGEHPALAGIARDAILGALAVHEANYRRDPGLAAEAARQKLTPILDKPRLCSTVVRICRSIIPADGVIHPAEHRALAELRIRLGLTARPVVLGSFGLLGSGPKAAARATPT